MAPIEACVMWFLLGATFGAIASWLAFGPRRARKRPTTARADMPGSTAAPASTMPPIEAPSHHEPLASSRVIDVSAARAAGFNLRHADDLTVVDGIGPKTEEQLRANGVNSFIELACVSVDDVLDILERGGPSFRFANPESWPQQASLAAQNRWKELKQMQNQTIDRGEAAGDP